VLRGVSGEPLWPTGVVGSISHADGLCVAVVAAADRYRSIGVDVERSQRDIVELSDWILADAERQEDGRDIAVSGLMARFGAKESAIKCAFPLTQRVIEFNQLVVRLDIQAQRYSIRTANALDPDAAVFAAMEGRYAQDRQHNFCVSYVPASGRVRALRTAGA
jgi:4'-phosphopantetheinyl transferase EntD